MKRSILAVMIAMIAMSEEYASGANEFPESKVSFRVTDQTGAPVTNACVSVNSYTHPPHAEGLSDSNGVFTYTDRIAGEVICRVSKGGYYDAHGPIWGGPHRWTDQPTNTFSIVLRSVVNPVPMIQRQVRTDIPRLDEPVAFDLEVGDWVEPDGKGKIKDVMFTARMKMPSRRERDVRVAVSFPGAVDGIQEFNAPLPYDMTLASDLVPPQEAPISGYTNGIALWSHTARGRPDEQSWVSGRNYIFSVRGKKDAAAKLLEANVGWTRGDIKVDRGSVKTVFITFEYYYNPDAHSRSLEPK